MPDRLLKIFLTTLLLVGSAAFADDRVHAGNVLYGNEQFDEALAKYESALLDDPENPILQFNIGNVQYKKKKFKEAQEAYEKVLQAKDASLQAKANYNLGNLAFVQDKLDQAIQYYKASLDIDPNDKDAKANLEIARTKLRELAKQQQQQQQDQQNQQQNQQQPEASLYAKRQYEAALNLVQQRHYLEAWGLVSRTLKEDPTFEQAYGDFVKKSSKLSEIFNR